MKKRFSFRSILLILALAVAFVFTSAMVPAGKANAEANKKDIVRVDFIHYVKGAGNASKPRDPGYKLMGVKWTGNLPVQYSLNMASVPQGLDAVAVKAAFGASSEVWDAGTATELFALPGETEKHYGNYDGVNAVEFGLYSGAGNVIAVTSVWYNRKTKSILEFDMLYNTNYAWGDADAVVPDVMDIANIATHELGHAIGLSDIYNASYSAVTMYGYASYNETIKRTLENPDLIGLRVMYGN